MAKQKQRQVNHGRQFLSSFCAEKPSWGPNSLAQPLSDLATRDNVTVLVKVIRTNEGEEGNSRETRKSGNWQKIFRQTKRHDTRLIVNKEHLITSLRGSAIKIKETGRPINTSAPVNGFL